MRAFLTIAVLLAPAAASGACVRASSDAALAERLRAAEQAYVDLDPEGFARAIDEATLLLPCVADRVSTETAAQLHRMMALQAFARGDDAATEAALAAARALSPAYRFPDALLPPDHALRTAYEALDAAPGERWRPPQPTRGTLAFDGVGTPLRPLDRPTVAQWLDPDGRALETAWVAPAGPLPAYPARHRARDRLLVGAAGLLGVAATTYGLAWSAHGPFNDPATADLATLERAQDLSIAYTAVAATCLTLSGGGVVFAFAWDGSRR